MHVCVRVDKVKTRKKKVKKEKSPGFPSRKEGRMEICAEYKTPPTTTSFLITYNKEYTTCHLIDTLFTVVSLVFISLSMIEQLFILTKSNKYVLNVFWYVPKLATLSGIQCNSRV